jgi:tetratricopeptide (TPR) repeat protein
LQTDSRKKWITPLVIVGALLLVLLLSNRSVETPEDMGVIDTPDEYAKALQMAHEMTKPIFDKSDKGEEITEKEKDQLYKAARLIDNANRVSPEKTIPFLGAGKAYMLAGDLEMAELRFRQAINNAQFDASPGAKETGVEAQYRLSEVRFELHDYEGAFESANHAVKAVPDGIEYLTARAAALIQLKKYKEADADLHAALKLDPTYQKAIGLHKLLEAEDPETFGSSKNRADGKAAVH